MTNEEFDIRWKRIEEFIQWNVEHNIRIAHHYCCKTDDRERIIKRLEQDGHKVKIITKWQPSQWLDYDGNFHDYVGGGKCVYDYSVEINKDLFK